MGGSGVRQHEFATRIGRECRVGIGQLVSLECPRDRNDKLASASRVGDLLQQRRVVMSHDLDNANAGPRIGLLGRLNGARQSASILDKADDIARNRTCRADGMVKAWCRWGLT